MDAKVIKKLKDFKGAVLIMRDDSAWTKGNQEFYDKATAFINSIPHYKKDFEGIDENALVREYSAIKMLNGIYQRKYIEYINTVPPTEEMPIMPVEFAEKKETEIKEEQAAAPSNDNEVIEIKQERAEMDEKKKVTEIKQEETPKKSPKKKETKIKEEQVTMSLRGGKREGAGRKAIGIKKAVSIALPEDVWDEISNLIQNGNYESNADFFRSAAYVLLSGGDSK